MARRKKKDPDWSEKVVSIILFASRLLADGAYVFRVFGDSGVIGTEKNFVKYIFS